MEVLCIGHAAWDLFLPVPEFPVEDSKVEVPTMSESGGGPAANAAYLLSKWGVRCGFAGLLGDDEYGRRVLADFREIGTDTSLTETRPGHVTPLSVVLVNRQNGTRTVINRRAPAAGLSLRPLADGVAPRVLLFDGHELGASLEAMSRFPGAKTVLDAGSLRDGTRELARRVDYLVASERFARQLTSLPALDADADRAAAVAALYRLNGKPVVITLGSRGLVHGTDAGYEHQPAQRVRAVDTTAAGDVFHGAFAYGILHGLPWHETLRLASRAAALSVTRPGGRASIPAKTELQGGQG